MSSVVRGKCAGFRWSATAPGRRSRWPRREAGRGLAHRPQVRKTRMTHHERISSFLIRYGSRRGPRNRRSSPECADGRRGRWPARCRSRARRRGKRDWNGDRRRCAAVSAGLRCSYRLPGSRRAASRPRRSPSDSSATPVRPTFLRAGDPEHNAHAPLARPARPSKPIRMPLPSNRGPPSHASAAPCRSTSRRTAPRICARKYALPELRQGPESETAAVPRRVDSAAPARPTGARRSGRKRGDPREQSRPAANRLHAPNVAVTPGGAARVTGKDSSASSARTISCQAARAGGSPGIRKGAIFVSDLDTNRIRRAPPPVHLAAPRMAALALVHPCGLASTRRRTAQAGLSRRRGAGARYRSSRPCRCGAARVRPSRPRPSKACAWIPTRYALRSCASSASALHQRTSTASLPPPEG